MFVCHVCAARARARISGGHARTANDAHTSHGCCSRHLPLNRTLDVGETTSAIPVSRSAPWERRDLGVMYLHAGRLDEALAELREYRRSEHARRSAAAERELVDLLLALLQESGVQPCAEGPLCLERELNRERPEIELTRRAIEW
ncbi:unnamed protein product [Pedinophyceae sp. YPF-701]|nr:unnamed protein product [Pedinophyceae sp. YPF-701]